MRINNYSKIFASTLIISGFLSSAILAEDRVLKVTNWEEYIGEETIANFEAEYGIKVIYDGYDSAESIDAKLLAGSSGYDVVSHSGSMVARLIKAGIVASLDKSKLDNMKNMDPSVLGQLAKTWDPGNNHIIPYMWGTHGKTKCIFLERHNTVLLSPKGPRYFAYEFDTDTSIYMWPENAQYGDQRKITGHALLFRYYPVELKSIDVIPGFEFK